jgi:hypothetical protein
LLQLLWISLLCAQDSPTLKDMQACYERNKEAYVKIDGYPAIALTSKLAIAPNIGKAPKSYVKYDPFINAYILRSPTPLKPVPQNEERALKKGAWLTPISADKKMKIGQLVSLGSGLGDFDKLSVSAPKGAIITGGCCDMYGIGIGGRFVGNRYLEHIVAYDTTYYGYIGADFASKNKAIVVKSVDPFFGSNLKISDEITHIQNRAVNSLRELNEAILFAPEKKELKLKIKRAGKSLDIVVKTRPLPLKPLSNRTYLEPLGMHFDSKLVLRRVDLNSKASLQGLEVGDKLLQIGNVALKSPAQLRTLLSTLDRTKQHHMLFERNNFQFFITLELPKN